MKRFNAHGELTDIPRKAIKKNIVGLITKYNKNYSPKDIDALDPLFPEELETEFTGVKQNRERMKSGEFPDRLPTAGLTPYPIDEDVFIGQHESPKNIYLTLAHAYNKAMDRIEKLEKKLNG